MYGIYINVSFNGEKRRSQEWTSVVVKQSHSHGSSIHYTGSNHGCSFNGNQWTRTTLRRKNIWNGRLSIHGIYVIDLLWRDVIKPCRKLRHVSIHGRTVRCSRRNISIGYGTTLLHSITQIYAIQLYSTRIPSHTIYGWTDRTGYCSICWNLSCVNISNDYFLPIQNEETGWRNIGT